MAEADPPTPPLAQPPADAAQVLREVERVLKDTTSDLSTFVDTKTNAALIMFGGLVILIGLGMMFHINEYRLLTPSEFFAVIILGLVLIVLGAGRRVLQLRDAAAVQRDQLQEATKIARVIRGRDLEA